MLTIGPVYNSLLNQHLRLTHTPSHSHISLLHHQLLSFPLSLPLPCSLSLPLTQELELYSPDLLNKPALLMVNKMDSANAESRLKALMVDLSNMDGE